MTKALQALPPRPRAHRIAPGYPTLIAVGLSVSLASCGSGETRAAGAMVPPFDAAGPRADVAITTPDTSRGETPAIDGAEVDGGGQDGESGR